MAGLVFWNERDAKERAWDLYDNAKNAKYYEWTYEYDRYNPQLGTHRHTSTVIAKTKAAALAAAKKSCNGGVYGYNTLVGLVEGSKKLLERDVDYKLVPKAEVVERRDGSRERRVIGIDYKAVLEVERIYHN